MHISVTKSLSLYTHTAKNFKMTVGKPSRVIPETGEDVFISLEQPELVNGAIINLGHIEMTFEVASWLAKALLEVIDHPDKDIKKTVITLDNLKLFESVK